MNKFISHIVSFFTATIFPVLVFCQPQSREELTKQKQQIQKEIEALNESLKNIQTNKSSVLKKFNIVKSKIEARERLVNNINKEMKSLDEDMYLKQIEIYRLKKELDTLKKKYAQSVVYAYKNRSNYQYLNFLFSANSFNDALKRVSYLKGYRKLRELEAFTINKTQNDLQKNIKDLNLSIQDKKGALINQTEQLQILEDDKKQKDEVVKDLNSQEKDINAQITRREKQRREINNAITAVIRREAAEAERKEKERLAKIKAAEELRKKELAAEAAAARLAAAKAKADADAKSKADASKAAAEAKAKKAEEDAKKAELKSTTYNTETAATGKTITMPNGKTRDYSAFEGTKEGLTLSLNFEANRGKLPWPVNNGTICGRFGIEQINAHLKIERDGIFICLPVGTSVKSVADGDVSLINDLDGEYKYVMIRHGRYITLYNRLTDVNVIKGQKVNAGTLIGKAAMGDTGEGEFEFRVMNGSNKFVNPEPWLKSR